MSTKEELHDKLSEITREHLESVSGGLTISCSAEEFQTLTENLVTMYENAISATSYMIERVANSVSGS